MLPPSRTMLTRGPTGPGGPGLPSSPLRPSSPGGPRSPCKKAGQEAMGWGGGAAGQPPASSLLTFSPGSPRSPGSPCVVGRGLTIVSPAQELSRVRTPPLRPPWGRGHSPVHRGGRGGPPPPASERDTQQGGTGEGRGSWVLAHPCSPGPQLSCRKLPILLSHCLLLQRPRPTLSPGTPGEPASPRAPFAPSSPGSPASPCQGRAQQSEGTALPHHWHKRCAEPMPEPVLSTSAYAV